MKIKKYIFIAVYILSLIIELFFYVPYEQIEVFRSKQNVPHTEVVGNGYIPIDEIRKDAVQIEKNDKIATGKRVDSKQLIINLFSTTMLALWIYLIFIHSDEKIEAFKHENEWLQRKVDMLDYNNQILCEYKTMFLQFKNALAETANDSNMENIAEIPTIDINELAFVDEDTLNEVMKQYADNICAYTAYKIYSALKSETSK